MSSFSYEDQGVGQPLPRDHKDSRGEDKYSQLGFFQLQPELNENVPRRRGSPN